MSANSHKRISRLCLLILCLLTLGSTGCHVFQGSNLEEVLREDGLLDQQLERTSKAAAEAQSMLAELRSPDPTVQAKALERALGEKTPIDMDALLPLLDSPSPQVRSQAILALAAKQSEPVLGRIVQAVHDTDLEVRRAAVKALGRIRSVESRLELHQLYDAVTPALRADVILALNDAEDSAFILKQVHDEQWRVRAAIAESLSRIGVRFETEVERRAAEVQQGREQLLRELQTLRSNAQDTVAQTGALHDEFTQLMRASLALLEDASAEVRWQTTQAITDWHIELSGPLLWNIVEQDQSLRARRAAELRLLEHLLPDVDAQKLVSLNDEQVVIDRLRAVVETEYAHWLAFTRQLSQQTTPTLAEWVNADGQVVLPQVYQSLQSNAHDRVAACQYLATHPDAKHIKRLVPLLHSEVPTVLTAAIAAVAKCGQSTDSHLLLSPLRSNNYEVQVAAALGLLRMGDPQGTQALERLLHSGDWRVRRQVAVTMPIVNDPLLAPKLVALLEDKPAVVNAALISLAAMIELDDHDRAALGRMSQREKVRFWQSYQF